MRAQGRKSQSERESLMCPARRTPLKRDDERIRAICALVLVVLIVGVCLWLYLAQPGMLGM